jgi:hypothetical protein
MEPRIDPRPSPSRSPSRCGMDALDSAAGHSRPPQSLPAERDRPLRSPQTGPRTNPKAGSHAGRSFLVGICTYLRFCNSVNNHTIPQTTKDGFAWRNCYGQGNCPAEVQALGP